MRLDVAMQVAQLRKRLGALRTTIGLFTRVCPDVRSQVILLRKCLWTEAAGKWTLT